MGKIRELLKGTFSKVLDFFRGLEVMDRNPECPAAPCGIFCGACDVYLANLRGTVQELAREWGRPPEDLRCLGCLSPAPETAIYC